MERECSVRIPIQACIVIVGIAIPVALWLEKSLKQLLLWYLMHPNCDRKYYIDSVIPCFVLSAIFIKSCKLEIAKYRRCQNLSI